MDTRSFPLRLVSGNYIEDGGALGPTTRRPLHVAPDGKVYDADNGTPLATERWSDGDYLDSALPGGFMVDSGEFARIGITPMLCGDAKPVTP